MINSLKKKKKKGFTLIELIIVIAILAILAAIAVPQFGKIRQNANDSANLTNAKTIHSAAVTAITQADEPIEEIDDPTEVSGIDWITEGLQNVPQVKGEEDKNFYVTVVDGEVTVFITEDSEADKQVYLEQ